MGHENGLSRVLGFRFNIDSRTMAITESTGTLQTKFHHSLNMLKFNFCLHIPTDSSEKESKECSGNEMFTGLSVVHLACVFDQEDVLEYFVKLAGMARGKLILKLKSTPFGQVLHG